MFARRCSVKVLLYEMQWSAVWLKDRRGLTLSSDRTEHRSSQPKGLFWSLWNDRVRNLFGHSVMSTWLQMPFLLMYNPHEYARGRFPYQEASDNTRIFCSISLSLPYHHSSVAILSTLHIL
jgi:hypothetical protein